VNRDGAWLTLAGGARKGECSVIDLAPGEAKIAVEPEFEIGDTFELSLVEVQKSMIAASAGKWFGAGESMFGIKLL
jgi:hypothetical protein